MRRLLVLAAMVTLIGTATVGTLAAAILGSDPAANTAAAVALLAGSILAVVGAIVLYRRQPKAHAGSQAPAKSWSQIRREIRDGVVGIAAASTVVWVGGYVSVWFFPSSTWAYQWRYTFEDYLDGATFHVEPKPHDCEFLTAPLGAKHCEYEAVVTTIRIGRSESGRLVSYDDGKTWQAAGPSDHPAVFVRWRKVDK